MPSIQPMDSLSQEMRTSNHVQDVFNYVATLLATDNVFMAFPQYFCYLWSTITSASSNNTLIRHVSLLAPFSSSCRPQLGSFGYQKPVENIMPASSTQVEPATTSCVFGTSLRNDASVCLPQLARRRRRASPLPGASSDPAIGQVTRLGKFKCLDPGCDDLTFGRQADFKRHYENVHAPRKIEYFCPQEGCSRSRKPVGGKSKGRSFNNRKDKMEEHLRTVHHKRAGKRMRFDEDDTEYGEETLDEGFGEQQPRIGRRRY
ncbi:hypothetical protein BKA66DRAFT_440025 [Pyrenochaeta sp. MPI-SDFR-AT-0127]|nr:hypothetical protein BKA66DRAFT_440025 [Pyrenochaeta sp. MPI-SDFR-AT-0127]